MHLIYMILLAIVVVPAAGLAQHVPLPPGTYITAGGHGHLVIKHGKAGALRFAIESTGSNGHQCGLDGEIRHGQATLAALHKDQPCIVRFRPRGDGIDVEVATAEACRYFCGVRAGFEGRYLKPAPGCVPTALRETRDAFKRLYDQKSYAKARATLEPVLKRCAQTLYWLDEGWMRNDLAITQYRLGDLAACRQTLQPLAQKGAMTEEEVRAQYPPADAENVLPIWKATRTNLQLCKGQAQ